MFTATDLADIRAEQQVAMDQVATIQRYSLTSDGQGGNTQTWNTLATNVKCRVCRVHRIPREKLVAMGLLAPVAFEIVMPNGQDVTPKDRIVVGSHTYEVYGDNNGESYQGATVAVCAELQT